MAEESSTNQKLVAEAIGTFILVFFGCGAAAVSGDFTAIALAFGLAILVSVYAFGRISGGHFNPAVSVGAALGGRMSWSQVPLYVGAQLAGAIGGAAVLWVGLHGLRGYDSTDSGIGQNFFGDRNPNTHYAWWAAFIVEVLATAIFVTIILAVTDARNEHPAMAPLAIGLTLTLIHLALINLTGTSVNPARSIGPALFAGGHAIAQLWLFILAPLIGGAAAGYGYPLLFGQGSAPVAGSGIDHIGDLIPAGAVPGYGAPDQLQQEWNKDALPTVAAAAAPAAATPAAAFTPAATTTPTVAATPVAATPAAAAATPQTASTVPPPGADRPVIIQDGWQWDYDAQEWKPAEAAPPPAGVSDTGTTQIRPPDAT